MNNNTMLLMRSKNDSVKWRGDKNLHKTWAYFNKKESLIEELASGAVLCIYSCHTSGI